MSNQALEEFDRILDKIKRQGFDTECSQLLFGFRAKLAVDENPETLDKKTVYKTPKKDE